MPVDRFLITVFAFMFNSLVYSGAREIAGGWKHHLLVSAVDKNIPFIPESLIIYFGCYIFWVWNYVLIAKLDKERAYRFYFADFFSRVICFAIFLLFPTTNIRPEITGSGFWEQGMRFLYYIDKADNLFPSIHLSLIHILLQTPCMSILRSMFIHGNSIHNADHGRSFGADASWFGTDAGYMQRFERNGVQSRETDC